MQRLQEKIGGAKIIDFTRFKDHLVGKTFIEACIRKYGGAQDFSPSFESFVNQVDGWKRAYEQRKEIGEIEIAEDEKIKAIVALLNDKTQSTDKRIQEVRNFFQLEPREKYRWRPPEPFLPFPPIASYMVSVFSKIAFDESEDIQVREKAIAAICKINYRWSASIEL